MYINLKKTMKTIERCMPENEAATLISLQQAYQHTIRLQSQLLSVIYDMETFGTPTGQEITPLAKQLSTGETAGRVVTLTIQEPLPSIKYLSESVEEHWKAMIHSTVADAAVRGPLPYFEKAFVQIEIITPKRTNNSRVWDTSNRAINVIINNLNGIFFRDDDMEHMAFSVVGRWGEKGITIIRISDFKKWQSSNPYSEPPQGI